MRRALASALLPAVLLGGCRPAVSPPPATVSLRLSGHVPDGASVVIDDVPIGTFDFVAAHGVALPPSSHRITVQASGYFPWDETVTAKAGQGPLLVPVTLTPIPD